MVSVDRHLALADLADELPLIAIDDAVGKGSRAIALPTDALTSRQLFALEQLIDDRERDRSEGFRFDTDRRDFIAAHALIRLSVHLHFPDLPLPIAVSDAPPGTKPTLVLNGKTHIDFSISHSRGLVACATAQDLDIGVDCEPLTREVDLALMEMCFSRTECDWLADQGTLADSHAFLCLWTLKEAIVKAHGSGLSTDLKRVTVLAEPTRLLDLDPTLGKICRWSVRQWHPTADYVVALAARRRTDKSALDATAKPQVP